MSPAPGTLEKGRVVDRIFGSYDALRDIIISREVGAMSDENEANGTDGLTRYLERGLELIPADSGGFYAYFDCDEDPEEDRSLGDVVYQESRHLLAVTNPMIEDGRLRVLVIPHEEAGPIREAIKLLPEEVKITRKVGGSYSSTGGEKPEIPTETLTYTLYAIRPVETSVSYDEAMRGK